MAIKIQKNFPLKNYNSFGIDANCQYFVEVNSIESLQKLLANPIFKETRKLILGEGSNVLFSQDFPGLVVKIALKGIKKVTEDNEHVWVSVAAGENWHELVMYCLKRKWAGIENLSLIPGTVGAAPMQNIGAYGVELKDIFEELVAVRLSDGELCIFDRFACRFGYRESIFKKEYKDQYIIVAVTLRLNKIPTFHLNYGAIKDTLTAMQVKQLSIQAVSEAVIKIRQQKLPDPKKIGNAGSFFKSPVLFKKEFLAIQEKYPELPYFVDENERYKIPAGWIIEQCGWKGRRLGDAGVHEHHALVLVNYGRGSGKEIKSLAEAIQSSVKDKFSITLLPEVNII